MNRKILFAALIAMGGLCAWFFIGHPLTREFKSFSISKAPAEAAPASPRLQLVLYTKPVVHIFFHSLLIYPEKAAADSARATLFKNNMITVAQFRSILQELYDNGFVLFDSRLLYSLDSAGKIHQSDVYVPKGKKPLVLSLDDLNYYQSMKNDGFADKLVLVNGSIETEVATPEGAVVDTKDGDVIPILEDFIAQHPDFSLNGARGIIGVTGFDGILGYRTELPGAAGERERQEVAPVVAALKKSGWIFASHSYTHGHAFLDGTIATSSLAADIASWKEGVEPLVGPTNIFIGPFGQTFSEGDPRRAQLLSAGFTVLYGVGLDGYVKYFDRYVVMDRVDVDGYRLTHNKRFLRTHLQVH